MLPAFLPDLKSFSYIRNNASMRCCQLPYRLPPSLPGDSNNACPMHHMYCCTRYRWLFGTGSCTAGTVCFIEMGITAVNTFMIMFIVFLCPFTCCLVIVGIQISILNAADLTDSLSGNRWPYHRYADSDSRTQGTHHFSIRARPPL